MAASSSVHEIAARYASALFSLAGEQGALDAVADSLRTVLTCVEESAPLRRLTRSPVARRADQIAAMAALGEALSLPPLARDFLRTVAENRRLAALEPIARRYEALLADHRGEVTARVVTAKDLSQARMDTLQEALNAALGRAVIIRHTVDPTVLGGLLVRVGSRMVDATVRARLQKLRLAMKGA